MHTELELHSPMLASVVTVDNSNYLVCMYQGVEFISITPCHVLVVVKADALYKLSKACIKQRL